VFQGEPDEINAAVPDLTWAERLPIIPLVALIVFLGVYPKPVLDRVEPSVKRIIDRMEIQVERYSEPVTQGGTGLDPEAIREARGHLAAVN